MRFNYIYNIYLFFVFNVFWTTISANRPPVLIENMDNLAINENLPVGSVIYTLKAIDPENSSLHYSLEDTNILTADSKTGIVKVSSAIDREKLGESIKLNVVVEDVVAEGRDNNIVRVPITVFIIDENDNPPEFDIDKVTKYEVNVSEDTPLGNNIINELNVYDIDQVGSILRIQCPNCLPYFSINLIDDPTASKLSCSISLIKQLEYKPKQDPIVLKFITTDGLHETSLNIRVNIIDVQNRPPIFIGSRTAVIGEDLPIGSLVITIKAIDGDFLTSDSYRQSFEQTKPENGARFITYELISNPLNCFSLDLITGQLRVANKLDKEAFPSTNGVITLKVRASEVLDITEPNRRLDDISSSSVTSVIITLQDVNDEMPTFSKNDFHVTIPEGVPNGTPLSSLDMMVEDRDTGSNSVFNIALQDDSGIFSVEPPLATGSSSISIKVSKGPLDYENPNQRKFILLVIATEAFTKEKYSSTSTVTVTVEDVNDNQPIFEEEFYTGSVLEDAFPGTIIQTIKATDRDSSKITLLTYSLFGNGAELFSVNPSTGVITVADCDTPGEGNCIDYETRKSYYLSYQANDGFGQLTVVPLTINIMDSNDNPPLFMREKYSAIIDEGASQFDPPLKVTARDADATSVVLYSILGGNHEGLFSIEPRTGEIKLNREIRSTSQKITLKVQASDDGKGIATVDVEIIIRDANDNAPIFEKAKYLVTIPESSKVGTLVERVRAIDADSGTNAEIDYFIQRGAFDTFFLDNETGTLTVANSSLLDYDRKKVYNIQVIAVDRGIPSKTGTSMVIVKVINNNDKSPYFRPITQRCQLNENTPIGTKFCQLNATDPDADSSDSLEFRIENIEAVDKNGIQLNPSDPKIDIIKQYFAVGAQGYVSVASKLNRDIAAVITLNVSATDRSSILEKNQIGYGNLIITIIDFNEHPPTFRPPWTPSRPEYTFSMLEEQPIGTVVANILAIDLDSKISKYDIKPESEFFDIGSESGVVVLKKVIDFEKLDDPNLKFTIIAYDSGTPQLSASAFVTVNVININDNEPVFSQSYYNTSVPENAPPGTQIIVIKAKDNDKGKYGKIKYSIISQSDYISNSGSKIENFIIEEDTGVVKVAHGARLDRESGPKQITLQLAASDNSEVGRRDEGNISDLGGQTRLLSVPVYITILDVNDNSPSFIKREYESTILGNSDGESAHKVPILQVTANDPDEGINGQVAYRIISGNLDNLFEIDSKSGNIYAVKSPLETNDHLKEYKLKVEARDMNGKGPYFDEIFVRIKVIEINRHKPRFLIPSTSTISFLENQKSNTKVVRVEAYDDDIGHNGIVRYSFKLDGSSNVQETDEFKIDPDSGLITSKIAFDRETRDKYELVLSASDYLGEPQSFESLQKLTVIIKDMDDNKPEFKRIGNHDVTYIYHIAENEPRGSIIGRVTAIDRDEIENKVYYYIIDGNWGYKFHIDRNSGLIYSNVSFDRETKSEYDLVVKASSNPDLKYHVRSTHDDNPLIKVSIKDRSYSADDLSLVLVKILITDVNDNKPTFTKSIYRIGINHKAEIGRQSLQVIAIDADQGVNSTLIYTISAVDLYRKGYDSPDRPIRPIPSPFSIDPNNGKIYTTELMAQYPVGSRFVLYVEAREKASPHRIANCKVYLWVYDESKLIKMTIKLKPEFINTRKDEIEEILSKATEQRAIINEIKYHSDYKLGQVIKKWSDIFVLVVDDQTFIDLNPVRIIGRLDSKAGELRAEKQILIEEIALASNEYNTASFMHQDIEELDIASLMLLTMIILLIFGFVAMSIGCCCLKSWYHQKLLEKASKASFKSKFSVINEPLSLHGSALQLPNTKTQDTKRNKTKKRPTSNADKRQQVPRSSKENPLWSETGTKFYEEQELSFRMSPNAALFENAQDPAISNANLIDSESNYYATLAGTFRNKLRQRQPPETNDNHEYHELSDESESKNGSKTDTKSLVANDNGEPQLVGHLL